MSSLPSRYLLQIIGFGLVGSVPLVMAAANKSLPALLVLAALFFTTAALLGKGRSSIARVTWKARLTPAGWVIFTALVWSVLSVAWSHDRILSLQTILEVLVPLVSVTVIGLLLPIPVPRRLMQFLTIGFLAAATFIIVELKFGYPFRHFVGGRIAPYALNRPTVTLVLLYWPLLNFWRTQGRSGYGFALGVILALTVFVSVSGASKLGLFVGIAAFGITLLAPRHMLACVIGGVAIWMLIQPGFGRFVDYILPEQVVEWTAEAHSRERIDIWKSFGAVTVYRPFIGTGIGTSATLDANPVAKEIAPDLKVLLAVGHPHNNFLQIWVELGFPGAVLFLMLWFWLAFRLTQLPTDHLPERLAFIMSAASIALVSHGAWQGWWIGAISLGALLLWSTALKLAKTDSSTLAPSPQNLRSPSTWGS